MQSIAAPNPIEAETAPMFLAKGKAKLSAAAVPNRAKAT